MNYVRVKNQLCSADKANQQNPTNPNYAWHSRNLYSKNTNRKTRALNEPMALSALSCSNLEN